MYYETYNVYYGTNWIIKACYNDYKELSKCLKRRALLAGSVLESIS